jgi:hypothetical protein
MVEVLTKPVSFQEIDRALAKYLPKAATESVLAKLPSGDRGAALALIAQLMPLLAQQKFDAFACFGKLKATLEKSVYSERIEKAGAMLNLMEFDQVAESMNRLVTALEAEGEK